MAAPARSVMLVKMRTTQPPVLMAPVIMLSWPVFLLAQLE